MKTALLALACLTLAFGFSLDAFITRIATVKGWFAKKP